MANTTGICNSFKQELFLGYHNFGTGPTRGTSTNDTVKAALYLTTATVNNSSTAYSATGEVTGTGYTAGGVSVTAQAPGGGSASTTAYWQPGGSSISFGTVTLSTAFDSVLLYNSSQGNRSIAIWNFGSTTVNNGTFQINLPTYDSTNALIRIA
jgi:hypothetical protein